MKSEFQDGILTLFFSGEVSSTNAMKVEKEVESALTENPLTGVILDFAELDFISSAGLRIVLKVKQRYKDTKIINATLGVYDVLEMTGFTNIMSVSKIMAEIDITGAEIVGDGYFSTVYRIDKDTIVKVFNRTSDEDQVQRELSLAKEAFILGIPTAISYDIVRVGEKYGVRFEMLDCDSLKNLYKKHPEDYENLTSKYAELLKTINSTEPLTGDLRHAKDLFLEKLEAVKGYLKEEEYKKVRALFESVEDKNTFVHGDCHFKNIMVQNGELLLIDMDTLSVGDPIFEYAAIYAPYIAFEEDDPGNNERFLGVSSELTNKLMNDLIVRAFPNDSLENNRKKIALTCYVHMMWWNRQNEPENQKRFDGNKSRLLKLLDEVHDLKLN